MKKRILQNDKLKYLFSEGKLKTSAQESCEFMCSNYKFMAGDVFFDISRIEKH